MVAGRKANWKSLFESNIAGSSELLPHHQINDNESCLLPEKTHISLETFDKTLRHCNEPSRNIQGSALELISTRINTN